MKHSTIGRAAPVVAALLAIGLGSPARAQKPGPHAKVTAAQARAAALRRVPGKVQGKVRLENEEGKWQYAVMIRSGKALREVMVDAGTGRVATVENTTNEEEAREARQETKKKGRKAPARGR